MFGDLSGKRPLFLFDQNGGGGSSTDTSAGGAEDTQGKQTETEPKPKKTGDEAKEKKKAVEWSSEQQEELNRLIGETRKEERKKAHADFTTETAKAKKDADDKALEEKQEFKTLAEKRQAEIEQLKTQVTELSTAKEQGEKYKAALESHLKTQIEKLSKPYQALISKLDPLEQIEFLTKNAKDLGVKLESIDPTPAEKENDVDGERQAQAKKTMATLVKSWT